MKLAALLRWRPIRLAGAVRRRADDDGAGATADALTYQGFLALFPLLLLAVSAAGYLLAAADQDLWTSRLAAAVPGLDELAGDAIRGIVRHRESAGLIGLAGLAWRGAGLVEAAGRALGRIFGVPEYKSFMRRKAWTLASLALLGTLGLVAAAASGWASSFEGPGAVAGALLLALLLDTLLFLTAYRLLVQRRGPAFGRLWKGALLAGAAWGALKLAGAALGRWSAGGAAGIFGPFAAIVGLLFLLRLGAMVFLHGAELNAVLIEETARRGAAPESPAERPPTRTA